MNDRTPRRWLTFSLRSLFVLVLIVAAYFAGWRSATWTAEREKEAAVRKAVEELQASREKAENENRVGISVADGIVLGDRDQPEVYVIPELDSVVATGPPEQTERVRRFLEMQKFFSNSRSGGKTTSQDQPSDPGEAPPSRAPHN